MSASQHYFPPAALPSARISQWWPPAASGQHYPMAAAPAKSWYRVTLVLFVGSCSHVPIPEPVTEEGCGTCGPTKPRTGAPAGVELRSAGGVGPAHPGLGRAESPRQTATGAPFQSSSRQSQVSPQPPSKRRCVTMNQVGSLTRHDRKQSLSQHLNVSQDSAAQPGPGARLRTRRSGRGPAPPAVRVHAAVRALLTHPPPSPYFCVAY